jgi:hypothetical protein
MAARAWSIAVRRATRSWKAPHTGMETFRSEAKAAGLCSSGTPGSRVLRTHQDLCQSRGWSRSSICPLALPLSSLPLMSG